MSANKRLSSVEVEWKSETDKQLVDLQDMVTYLISSIRENYYEYAHEWSDCGVNLFRDLRRFGPAKDGFFEKIIESHIRDTEDKYRTYAGKDTEDYLLKLSNLLDRIRSVLKILPPIQGGISCRAILDETIDFSSKLERRVLKYSISSNMTASVPNIPAQMPAPIKVAVVSDVLEVIDSSINVDEISSISCERLRASFAENLYDIIATLEKTNIDARFISVLKIMLKYLSIDREYFSPEALGVNFEIYEDIIHIYKEEITEVTLRKLDLFARYMPMFLNQYEDWRKLKSVMSSNLSNIEIKTVFEQAVELANDLATEDNSKFISKEISYRIRIVTDPIRNGYIRPEDISIPLFTSISNVFAGLADAALTYALNNSNIVSAAIPTLGIIAVGILRKHARAFSEIPGLKFVKQVLDYISDVLKQGKI